jgi:hypothetical protein
MTLLFSMGFSHLESSDMRQVLTRTPGVENGGGWNKSRRAVFELIWLFLEAWRFPVVNLCGPAQFLKIEMNNPSSNFS